MAKKLTEKVESLEVVELGKVLMAFSLFGTIENSDMEKLVNMTVAIYSVPSDKIEDIRNDNTKIDTYLEATKAITASEKLRVFNFFFPELKKCKEEMEKIELLLYPQKK